MKKLWIPGVLTFVYLVCISLYAAVNSSQFQSLKPNELADFLGGVFAPLAFLWLVFGYLMQSQELALQRNELEMQRLELAQNNEALRAQELQMRRTAELQEQSLNEQREQWKLENEPVFRYHGHYNRDGKARLTLVNRGAKATEVTVEIEQTGEIRKFPSVEHASEIVVSDEKLSYPAKPLPKIKLTAKGPDGTWHTRLIEDPVA